VGLERGGRRMRRVPTRHVRWTRLLVLCRAWRVSLSLLPRHGSIVSTTTDNNSSHHHHCLCGVQCLQCRGIRTLPTVSRIGMDCRLDRDWSASGRIAAAAQVDILLATSSSSSALLSRAGRKLPLYAGSTTAPSVGFSNHCCFAAAALLHKSVK
jgi:hypothetical protein